MLLTLHPVAPLWGTAQQTMSLGFICGADYLMTIDRSSDAWLFMKRVSGADFSRPRFIDFYRNMVHDRENADPDFPVRLRKSALEAVASVDSVWLRKALHALAIAKTGTGYFFCLLPTHWGSFRGRPRARSDNSRSSRTAILLIHASDPNVKVACPHFLSPVLPFLRPG